MAVNRDEVDFRSISLEMQLLRSSFNWTFTRDTFYSAAEFFTGYNTSYDTYKLLNSIPTLWERFIGFDVFYNITKEKGMQNSVQILTMGYLVNRDYNYSKQATVESNIDCLRGNLYDLTENLPIPFQDILKGKKVCILNKYHKQYIHIETSFDCNIRQVILNRKQIKNNPPLWKFHPSIESGSLLFSLEFSLDNHWKWCDRSSSTSNLGKQGVVCRADILPTTDHVLSLVPLGNETFLIEELESLLYVPYVNTASMNNQMNVYLLPRYQIDTLNETFHWVIRTKEQCVSNYDNIG